MFPFLSSDYTQKCSFSIILQSRCSDSLFLFNYLPLIVFHFSKRKEMALFGGSFWNIVAQRKRSLHVSFDKTLMKHTFPFTAYDVAFFLNYKRTQRPWSLPLINITYCKYWNLVHKVRKSNERNSVADRKWGGIFEMLLVGVTMIDIKNWLQYLEFKSQ